MCHPSDISSRHTVVHSNAEKTSLHKWIPSSIRSEDEVGRSFLWVDEVDTRGKSKILGFSISVSGVKTR